jgi:nuclear pore complex protein Nup160
MEPEPPILYKETRVNLEPASNASIVHIRLPAPTRSRDRRHFGLDKYGDDEGAYRTKNLATAASIYHRKYHNSPRSFLWRVLEDGTVLSLRAADVSKQQSAPDTNLILHLRFPNPIRASCVALADAPEHDALTVFALDHTNHLYTIVLRPDHFRKRSATENGVGDACKTHLAGTFSFKHPHRLAAISAYQVVVTFHDGGLIRFDRDGAHNGTASLLISTCVI